MRFELSRLIIPIALAVISLVCPLRGYSQATGTRNVYFIGNTTSNFTVDLTNWSSNGANNETADGFTTFYFGDLTCRVFILNAGPSQQTILSGTSVKLNVEYPVGGTNARYGVADPLADKNGSPITYGLWANTSPSKVLYFSNTAGSVPTLQTLPQTLNPGEAAIIESRVASSPLNGGGVNLTYTMGWLDMSKAISLYPWVKLHQACTGMISVSDTTANNPGFVVASGTMSYLSDSYQQYAMPAGGIVTRLDNAVDLKNVSGWGTGYSALWTEYSTNPLNQHKSPYSDASFVYGQVKGQCDAEASGNLDFYIDNNAGRSSFQPAHFQSLPIAINGGSPL